MSTPELPAIDWLGYGIDLSRSPTMDLRAAAASVLKGRRIIDFDLDDNVPVTIGGVVYNVPTAVRIVQETLSQGSFLSYATGGDARKAFQGSGLPTRYLAVTGTDSAMALAHDRSFIDGNQYAFFSFLTSGYAARLAEYDDLLNQTALLRGVEDLPRQFNGDRDEVVAAYKNFFQRFGTHVIVNVSYGARFQLNAWASNENTSVNAKFATNVKAFFNGVPSGGEYDAKVKNEAQYKVFVEYLQRLITVNGGDTQLSSNLASDPTNYQNYKKWLATVDAAAPMQISFHTRPIWSLMSVFPDDTLKAYAGPLDEAFTWILTYPRVYKTSVTFDIESDWAEFNLLTPSAIILADDANPYPSNTVASRTRVQWGKEHSHSYERKTLKFFVVNDGCPIDFSISHGNNGAVEGQGRAEAFIENESYLNSAITDNVWNTVWFFGAPVSLTPEALQMRGRTSGYSWNDILDEYLRSNGAATQAREGEE